MELKADKKVIVERNNKVVYDNGATDWKEAMKEWDAWQQEKEAR